MSAKLDGNELWEWFFSNLNGKVPSALHDELLDELAVHINAHFVMTPTDNLEAGAGDLVARLNRAAVDLERKFLHRIDHSGEDWRLVNPNGDLAAAIIREAAAQLSAVTAENARLREGDLSEAVNVGARAIYSDAPSIGGDTEDGWDAQSEGYKHKARSIAHVVLLAALSQEAPK